jgi:hypothetical protein
MSSGSESSGAPQLALVGFGYGDGSQLTSAGCRTLARARWIGHLGLPRVSARALESRVETAFDVERLVLAPYKQMCNGLPMGFGDLVAHVVVSAAVEFERAAMVLAGHPLSHNRAYLPIERVAAHAGVDVEVVAGVSALDNLAVLVGLDVGSGAQVLDARRLLALGYLPDPRLPLIILCPSYLGPDGDRPIELACALNDLGCHLLRCYPAAHPVHHVRFGSVDPADHESALVERVALGDLSAFASRIDAESSLLLPPDGSVAIR